MSDGLAIASRIAGFRCVFLVSSPFLRVFIRSAARQVSGAKDLLLCAPDSHHASTRRSLLMQTSYGTQPSPIRPHTVQSASKLLESF